MYLVKQIKRNALIALHRHWSSAMGIAVVSLLLSFLFLTLEQLCSQWCSWSVLTDFPQASGAVVDAFPRLSPTAMAVFGGIWVIYLLLSAPLRLGIVDWFYRLGGGHAEDVTVVTGYFSGWKRLGKAVCLRVSLFFRGLFWALAFLGLPLSGLFLSQQAKQIEGTELYGWIADGLGVLSWALVLLLGILYLCWLSRYYLAELILVDEPEISIGLAIRRSVYYSKGWRLKIISLRLSMLGWQLLDLLILPQLFTMGYRLTAKGLLGRIVFEAKRREQAALHNQNAEAQDPQ